MVALLALLLGGSGPLDAATCTWTGTAGDGKWSTASNWGGAAPAPGDDLVFAGSTSPVTNNDLNADTAYASITFSATATAFTLNGFRLTLTGAITDNSASAQIINLNIILTTTSTVNCASGAVTINGVVSGAGGGIAKSGANQLALSGANSFGGGVNISAGVVSVTTSNSALGSGGTVTVGAANGARVSLDSAGLTIANPLVINGNSTVGIGALHFTATGTATWSGAVSITANVTNGGHFASSAVTSLLVISGPITSTVPVLCRSGSVTLGNAANSLPTLSPTNQNVILGASGALPATANVVLGQSGNATLDLAGFATTVTGISQTANTTSVTSSSGTPTLTVNSASASTYPGALTGTLALTKTGVAAFTSSGANTYSGATTVSTGALMINGNSSGATGAVAVGASGTLGGTGTIGGAVTTTGGSVLSPGDASATTLTIAAPGTALDLSAGGTCQFTLGTASDRIACTGASSVVKLGGALVVTAGSGFTAGTYTLMTFTGSTSSGAFSSVTVPGSTTATVAIDNSAHLVTLTVPLINQGLSVAAGGKGAFTTTSLQAAQSGSTSAQVVYTVTSAPAHGFLRKSLVAVAAAGTFTQADVDNGLISYEHGDLASLSDSFLVSVSGNSGLIATATVTITATGSGLAASLAGWWRLDEAATTSASDSSGFGRTGTLNGLTGTEWTSGAINGALPLNGSSQWVDCTSIALANSSFTVSGWAKRSSTGSNSYIAGQGSGSTNLGLHFGFATNNFRFGFWGNDLTSGGTFTDTTSFHHWVGTYNATTRARVVYLDGAFLMSDTASANYQGSGSFLIGNSPVSKFSGTVDDVRLFTRDLSAEEAVLLFTAATDAAPVIANLDGDVITSTVANSVLAVDAGGDALVTDSDDLCFAGGALRLESAAGGSACTLSAVSAGLITVSGSAVSYNGNAIGTIDATLNGSGGNNLKIAFTTQYATPTAVSALLRALRYSETGANTSGRLLRVSVGDGQRVGVANVTVLANYGVTAAPGGAVVVPASALGAAQANAGTAQITYTLSTAPTRGALRRNLAQVALSGTFTQADIDANLVSYEEGDLSAGSDSFTVAVTGPGGSLGSLTVAVTVAGTGLVNGLVAYLPFEQTGGTTVPDTTGTYTGTVYGTAAWGAGQLGNALTFNGTSSYVQLPAGMADFTGGLTISVWAKPTAASNWARFVDFGNGSGSNNILFARNSTSATLDTQIYNGGSSSTIDDVSAITTGSWHHYLVAVSTGGASLRYVDGAQVGAQATLNVPPNVTRILNYVGKSNWSADSLFQGQMDELRVYNRAVVAGEAKLLASQAAPTTTTLDGASLAYAGDGSTVAIDVGGNATVADADDCFLSGGFLLVHDSNGLPTSTLTIAASGGITTSAGTVSSGGNAIGTIDATLNGAAGADLKVAFTTQYATPAAVQALVRALRFSDTVAAPRTFSISISDGALTPVPAVVTMTTGSTTLTVTTDTGLAVAAGASGAFSSASLAATDSAGQSAAQITYTLGIAPAHGFLRRSLAKIAASGTFTQLDVNNGLVSYEHGDLASLADSFNVTATDTLANSSGSVRVTIAATGSGLGTGLVTYLPLDDGSGSTAVDVSGNRYNATLFNTPTWAAARIGGGLTFNGTVQYGTFTRPVQDDWTMVYWFNTGATGLGGSGSQWSGGSGMVDGEVAGVVNDFGTSLAGAGYVLAGSGNPDTTVQAGPGFNDAGWHQLAFTRSRLQQVVALSVDNAAQVTALGGGTSETAPATLALARIQTGSRYFNGSLDDVRIYNRVLTSDERAALYAGSGDAAPVLANLAGDGVVITAAGTPFAIDSGADATVSDSDDLTLSGGYVLVDSVTGGTTTTLSVATSGGITTSGAAVSYNGNAIGAVDGTFTGAAGGSLRVMLTTSAADTTATAALIHALRYSDAAAVSTDHVLRVTVSDGLRTTSATTTAYGNIYLTANTGVTVSSGGAVTIEGGVLTAAQASATSTQIVYTVASAPAHGFLRKNLAALGVGGTFTQSDIGNNLVSYEHGDLASGSDALQVTIAGANGATISATTVAITVAGTGLANGLEAWWKFDESSGGSAADATGNGHTGTLVNGPAFGAGIVGNALHFTAASQQSVTVPYSAAFGLASYTVAARVRPTSSPANQGILSTRFGGDTTFDVKWTSTIVHGDVGDGSAWLSTFADIDAAHGGTLAAGTWYQVTYAIDNAVHAYRLSLNGALAVTATYSGTPLFMKTGETLTIGNAFTSSEFANGDLDDVRVYNRALSAGEARLLGQQAAPVIANLGGDTAAFKQSAGAVLLDTGPAAVVTDADDLCFAGGALQVVLTNRNGSDVLGIAAIGLITTSSGVVSYNGDRIGAVDATLNGTATHDLKVAFDTQYATPTAIAALIAALTYNNTDAPPTTTTRSVQVTLSDNTFTSSTATVSVTVARMPVITTWQTQDTDHNGKLDRIRVVTDIALNDSFAGLTATVSGYTVTGYSTGTTANDTEFFILLTEGASGDTGATPTVRITANTTLGGSTGNALLLTDAGTVAADAAAPVLLSSLWSDGGAAGVSASDTVTLTFSEGVTAASMTVADLGLPVASDTLSTTTIANQSGSTLTMTLAGTPRLTPGGTYGSGALTAAKPSGVFIASGAHLSDGAGLNAVAGAAASAVDLGPTATTVAVAWASGSDPKTWTIGALNVGTTANSIGSGVDLTVLNGGNCNANLTIASAASSPSGWSPAAGAGANAYLMKADASGAATGAPANPASYGLTMTTSAQSVLSGLLTGTTAPFYLYFNAPTSVTSGSATLQTITVTVTAALAP